MIHFESGGVGTLTDFFLLTSATFIHTLNFKVKIIFNHSHFNILFINRYTVATFIIVKKCYS